MATKLSGVTESQRPAEADAHLVAARGVLAMAFGPVETRTFAVRYWDSAVDSPPARSPAFTLRIASPAALRRALLPPSELRLAEAFVRGDLDVEGNLEVATAATEILRRRLARPAPLARLLVRLLALPRAGDDGGRPRPRLDAPGRSLRRHSRERDAAAVRSHYDVSNDFYGLWLDRNLVYSCAYFDTPSTDLDTAQEAKLDHICRKLRLSPGERLLDIGCGWGGLVRYAAARYGVEAVGITLSPPQAELARERIERDGLGDRCRVRLLDYRGLPSDETFDKIASVGMLEHVGRKELPRYFRQALDLLRPGGLFLAHGIVSLEGARRTWRDTVRTRLWREHAFVERYVFPDGELVPLAELVGFAEAAGFETLDVETLREHYALTLRAWGRRLERTADIAATLVGEQVYRTWRLNMAGSARAFAAGQLSVAQVLLGKPTREGRIRVPLTRADVYER